MDQSDDDVIQSENLDSYHNQVAIEHAPGTPVHIRLQRNREAHAKNNAGTYTSEDVRETSRRMQEISRSMKGQRDRHESASPPGPSNNSFDLSDMIDVVFDK